MDRRQVGPPHPWLARAPWFIEAAERVLTAIDPGDVIAIGIDAQRDREPTAGVRVETDLDDDRLDDVPGLRRLERRAAELARLLPAEPPFGARIRIDAATIAVRLAWHHPGAAGLVATRLGGGWDAADIVMMPKRHFVLPDEALTAADVAVTQHIDRLLGGDRIRRDAQIRSASRRDQEIRVVYDAGAIRDVPVW